MSKITCKSLVIVSIMQTIISHIDVRENKVVTDQKVLIGDSTRMRKLRDLIQKVANSDDSTVLIRGERGTGKENAARSIHFNSVRKNNNLVSINCAAIPEGLFESELFGCIASYPGLHSKVFLRGAVEKANGGSFFLDEIGDMPLIFQIKFLRFLQEKTYSRVGGDSKVSNCRIIAATNQNLEELIRERRFREDLYDRINVINIHMPPLREIREDIPLIIGYIIRKKYNGKIELPDKAVLERFNDYDFPGNVRELEAIVERRSVFGNWEESIPRSFEGKAREDAPLDDNCFNEFARRIIRSREFIDVYNAEIESKIPTERSKITREYLDSIHIDHRGLDLKKATDRFERALIYCANEACGGDEIRALIKLNLSYNTCQKKYGSD